MKIVKVPSNVAKALKLKVEASVKDEVIKSLTQGYQWITKAENTMFSNKGKNLPNYVKALRKLKGDIRRMSDKIKKD